MVKVTKKYSIKAIYDGFISYHNPNYGICRDNSSGTITEDTWLRFGQLRNIFGDNEYYIWRIFIFFDTSEVSPLEKILSANLKVYGTWNEGGWIYLIVQQGSGGSPHNPLIPGDYNRTPYSGNGGQIDVATFKPTPGGLDDPDWNIIPLNTEGLGYINKGGITALVLRSTTDIIGNAPTVPQPRQNADISSSREVDYEPILELTTEFDYNAPAQIGPSGLSHGHSKVVTG